MKQHNFRQLRTTGCLAGILTITTVLALSPAGPMVPTACAAESQDPMAEALKGDWGQINFDLRYRLEYVEQDDLKDTTGDPLRVRLGYLTPEFAGFQAFAEFEGNTPVFADDYNDQANDKTNYAVIADPQKAELNRGWLSYSTIPDTLLKGGRQRIQLDNQRFIGNVGWRQMEQTFDAVNLHYASEIGFAVDVSYLWNVRNISSENVNMQSPLLNLGYTFENIGILSAYGYWLDYDAPDNSGPFPYAFSTQTYGLRFNGKTGAGDVLNLLYTAEYANQSEYQDNPADYSSDYYHFIGGIVAPNNDSVVTNITGKLGYEVLGSDNEVSFKTSLGTNHAFNGWADQFLTVPPDGLADLYGVLSSTFAGWKVNLIYHDFQAESGSSDYGTEWNAMLTKKFADHYTLQIAYADYDADEFKVDTKKFWLQFTVAY